MTLPIEIKLGDVRFLLVTTGLYGVNYLVGYFFAQVHFFTLIVFSETLHPEINESCRFGCLSSESGDFTVIYFREFRHNLPILFLELQ